MDRISKEMGSVYSVGNVDRCSRLCRCKRQCLDRMSHFPNSHNPCHNCHPTYRLHICSSRGRLNFKFLMIHASSLIILWNYKTTVKSGVRTITCASDVIAESSILAPTLERAVYSISARLARNSAFIGRPTRTTNTLAGQWATSSSVRTTAICTALASCEAPAVMFTRQSAPTSK